MADGYVLVRYNDKAAKVSLQKHGINKPKTNLKCSKATFNALVKYGLIESEKHTKIRTTYKPAPKKATETVKIDKRVGNKFWEARAQHGRGKVFATKEDLWKACVEYFEWVTDNPIQEAKQYAFQGIVVTNTFVNKMRPMTIRSLCLFLDISTTTWDNYKVDKDFMGIVEDVDAIIYEQKFAGAASDQLNPNIIARQLGLKDASSTELTGANGGAIVTQNMEGTPEEIYKAMVDSKKEQK
ncbi:hypothetical protein KAR91_08755 [Candidatus Pacearchaeota archaeon]|nr:hypothetical protein [Candidatus Pacearchaeota archaeon]